MLSLALVVLVLKDKLAVLGPIALALRLESLLTLLITIIMYFITTIDKRYKGDKQNRTTSCEHCPIEKRPQSYA